MYSMQIDYQVAIIGAGFGGIIAALKLKNSNRGSFIIFEKANEVGGVWRDITYPGCTCDVKSDLYSIASEPNPNWSSSFANQPEIFNYLKNIVQKNDLQKYISYETLITKMKFIEENGCWELTDQHGKNYIVKLVILASGPINQPSIPAFTGHNTFKGKIFHSAEWDSSYDLSGKKAAVIGTGASAIQIIPNIAPVASELFVFQRTPAWVLPRGEVKNSAKKRWLYRNLPVIQKFNRGFIYWSNELVGSAFFGNTFMHKLLRSIASKKLLKEVHDPVIRKGLTPNYKMGCKRILVSDDFYPTFNKPNVHLVSDNIREITPNGIRTSDGRDYEVDAIVFATGFVIADVDNYVKTEGRNGHSLAEYWTRNGTEAYLGLNVCNFPNLLLLLGPNSGLGHTSMVHIMESQINYMIHYLEQIEKNGEKSYLDVKPEVQRAYNNELQKKLKTTVWSSGCNSWYLNKDGKNVSIYPGLAFQYRQKTKKFDVNNYVVGNIP